jgi:hypothetical protein
LIGEFHEGKRAFLRREKGKGMGIKSYLNTYIIFFFPLPLSPFPLPL